MEIPTVFKEDLSSILSAVQTALVLVEEKTGIIVYANERAGELFGRIPDEMTGRKCHGFICGDFSLKGNMTDKPVEVLHSGGTSISVVLSARTLSLEDRSFSLQTFRESPLKDALDLAEKANRLMEGREARIRDIKKEINQLTTRLGWGNVYENYRESDLGVSIDLSDPVELRKNALSLAEDAEIERLKAVEAHRQLVLIKHAVNSSNDAMIITKANGDVHFRNSTFQNLFGYSQAQILAKGQEELYPDREQYKKINRFVQEGKNWSGMVQVRKADGTFFPALLRLSPIRDEENQFLGSIWHYIDMTKQVKYQKQIEDDLLEKKELLRKALILQRSYIQRSIPLIDSFNIEALFLPCEDLGGDFFRILKGLCDNKLILILGDCTDHGIRSSMDASLLLSLTEPSVHYLYKDNRTDLFLAEISRQFSRIADEDQFPTMFVMIIDCLEDCAYYSSANSTNPLVYRKGKIERLPRAKGMHIGYDEPPAFERKCFRFEKGDRLLFFSDALTEILEEGQLHFDTGPLNHLFKQRENNLGVLFRYMIDHLTDRNEGFNTNDDMTLILMEYNPPVRFSYDFRSLEEWKEIQGSIVEILGNYDYRQNEVAPLTIALDEMAINAFVHGNRGDSSLTVLVEGTVNCESASFRITDQGQGFGFSQLSDPSENLVSLMEEDDPDLYTHGRGIWISRSYVDRLEYLEKGNVVEIVMSKKGRDVLISPDFMDEA